MDVSRSLLAVAGDVVGNVPKFLMQSGMQGSYLEGAVFEQLLGRERGAGVSAVQILQDALVQNIPLYLISATNINTVMPLLNISAEVNSNIVNAVSAGKSVLIPGKSPTHGKWSGTGYMVMDTQTGAGAYMISGNLNGGEDAPICQTESSLVPVVKTIAAIVFAVILVILLTVIIINAIPALIAAGGTIITAGGSAAGGLWGTVIALLGLGTLSLPASAGTLPAANLAPPGNCSYPEWRALNDDVWLKCSGSGKQSCADGMLCNDVPTMVARAQECVAARVLINNTCFAGGDEVHLNEIKNRQNGISNCLCILSEGRCVP
jgi:hypothetical protein